MVEGVTAGPAERPFGVLPILALWNRCCPDKGLAKGSVMAVDRAGALCVALLARPSQADVRCGVAGMPDLRITATAEASPAGTSHQLTRRLAPFARIWPLAARFLLTPLGRRPDKHRPGTCCVITVVIRQERLSWPHATCARVPPPDRFDFRLSGNSGHEGGADCHRGPAGPPARPPHRGLPHRPGQREQAAQHHPRLPGYRVQVPNFQRI
jgi:hypothetical protein